MSCSGCGGNGGGDAVPAVLYLLQVACLTPNFGKRWCICFLMRLEITGVSVWVRHGAPSPEYGSG